MSVAWRKVKIADETYEAAGAFDVNGDGIPDIVSGAYWYEGTDFTVRHRIGEVRAEGEYYDEFSVIPIDVNGDGRMDFVTGGWWGNTLRWRENPGDPDTGWSEHVIAETGNVETTRAWDVDGDGAIEIVPNTPNGPLVIYKLVTDEAGRGTGRFEPREIFPSKQGHGLGFGNISGSGRGDFVLRNGWLENPRDPDDEWVFHEDFDLGSASVPIIVADVNGDGLHDLIVGQAHDYGLHWWEQQLGMYGRSWVRRDIDNGSSQYHDMQWADIDGDGSPELITGKRYRAHCGKDPGAEDDIGIYYFKWEGDGFSRHVIDHGPPQTASGCGIQFATADLTGNGRLDIVAPGKDGLYVFFNEGG